MGALSAPSQPSTRRMKRMVEESRSAGASSLAALAHQGRQLDQVEGNLEAIGADVSKTTRLVSRMERCCCYDLWRCFCSCCCGRTPQEDEEDEDKGGKEERVNAVSWNREAGRVSGISTSPTTSQPQQQQRVHPDRSYDSLASSFSGGLIDRLTDDFREDEMEENLQDVNSVIHELRTMAMEQGSTLDQQNQQISRIQEATGASEERIHGVNQRMQAMLK